MRKHAALYGWLVSEAVSLTGTRISMLAIPWFVLTTTGSSTRTGITAFAEMAPYVLAKAVSGPWVDRLGAKRVCVGADVVSIATVGLIPLLHAAGLLSFPLLVALVAVAGVVRGPGDGARQAIVPAIVAAADVPTERATGLGGAVERLASTIGTASAGALIAAIGAAPSIVVDAATFAFSAVLLALTAPRSAPRVRTKESSSYRAELLAGWNFLRRDAVLVSMVSMIAVTNLLDAAYTAVLVPVWAKDSGGGAMAMGVLFAVFSGAAVLGSVVAASYATRLPRFTTYVVAFLVGGLPRFVVLGMPAPLAAVLAVAVLGGFAAGFINPILGAVLYERIPAELMGRVTALNSSLCWAGIPLGGLVGGLLVAAAGLSPAVLAAGLVYFGATLLPVLNRQWRGIDRQQVEPAPAAG